MKNQQVDEIKNRIKINDLISEYIKVNKAGSGFNALCPFHNEKTPSFSISPQMGIYKCFGCGESGDIFTFVQKYENVDFQKALEKLAKKAGVKLQEYKKRTPGEVAYKKQQELEKEILLNLLKDATKHFQINLFQNEDAKNYLKKRGVKEKVVKDFKLGYAKEGWADLKEYLEKKGYTQEQILKVGLVKKNEEKNRVYDRFRQRIMFPIFSQSGDVIAYSGRDLSGNDKVAKYLNSPQTLFFDKSDILYGFYQAKTEARKRGYFILVEGQMDLIMSHQTGFENTVATSGTSLTQKHLDNMSYFSKKIIFAFDSDRAGIEAAFRGIKLALKNDFDVKIVDIQKGKDPADMILEDQNSWKNSISEAKNFIDFYIGKTLNTNLSIKDKVKEMEEKILPFVAQIENPIEKGKYISKISKGFDVKESFVEDDLKKIKEILKKQEAEDYNNEVKNVIMERKKVDIFSKNNIIDKTKKKILKQLSSIYFWQKSLSENSFVNYDEILVFLRKNTQKDIFQKIIRLKEDVKKDLIFEVEESYTNKERHAIETDIDFLQRRLFDINKKEKIKNLQKELFSTDKKEKEKILKEIDILNKTKYGQKKTD
ncbi:DNA primase [Candidatus Campbellbacteria bacterium]|nr:MAG: DNA primase [Candidatus Campbellbacteria bacterium]